MSTSESISPSPAPAGGAPAARPSAWLAVRVLIVRLRFVLVLAAVVSLVGSWLLVRRSWERLRGAGYTDPVNMAPDMEFWCPMCPGVVSDWPGKCPVCNMALVRRKKAEPAALPDGVMARMQFSPYRVQLAGIRTAAVESRPLRREVVLVGPVERPASGPVAGVRAEVFAADLPFLREGQSVEAAADGLSGHAPFRGRVVRIEDGGGAAHRAFGVRLEIDDPDRALRPGLLVTARAEAPVARLAWWRRAVTEEGCKESAADVALHALLTPTLPGVPPGVYSLVSQAGTQAMLTAGYGPAVPCSAVIDHGSRKVIFVETCPGMFDATEIVVGPRCGDYYPVLRGVAEGQRVAAAGAFLLDAEMWLNHGVAATYFGATRGAATPAPAAPPTSTAADDRLLAARQKICPVTGEPLDSMGGPVRVEVAGRVVFICCKGCERALRKDPAKYFAKLPPK